jgi:hypothetical protein
MLLLLPMIPDKKNERLPVSRSNKKQKLSQICKEQQRGPSDCASSSWTLSIFNPMKSISRKQFRFAKVKPTENCASVGGMGVITAAQPSSTKLHPSLSRVQPSPEETCSSAVDFPLPSSLCAGPRGGGMGDCRGSQLLQSSLVGALVPEVDQARKIGKKK